MKMKTDYDKLSPNYNLRYKINPMPGISKALMNILSKTKSENILEVGCGTGHWLNELNLLDLHKFGVNYSAGMLKEAKKRNNKLELIRADANSLPFVNGKFDLIFCVNAIHQFDNKKEFILNSSHLLKPNGMFALFGFDPRDKNDKWYIYDYFEGTYEKDLQRFPSLEDITIWMNEAGLKQIEMKTVERIQNDLTGSDLFNDSFLRKDQSSQLASLSEEEYLIGMNKLKNAIKEDPQIVFPLRLTFTSVIGIKE